MPAQRRALHQLQAGDPCCQAQKGLRAHSAKYILAKMQSHCVMTHSSDKQCHDDDSYYAYYASVACTCGATTTTSRRLLPRVSKVCNTGGEIAQDQQKR